MPFYVAGSIKFYRFSSLENQGIFHAIFTRQGGVSPSPWESLNFGASVGDELKRVLQNREDALAAINIKPESVYDTYQIHSNEVVITDRPLIANEAHLKADAILTNKRNVTLMMRFADCVPVLLVDPVNHVIGLSHAGWIGTINKIVGKTVDEMRKNFGTHPDKILAAIGPSIGPDHYDVGNDVIEKVRLSFSNVAEQLIMNKDGKTYFNLWRANQVILAEVGVEKVEVAEICTACNLKDWFSHRREHGRTGRFGVVMGLS